MTSCDDNDDEPSVQDLAIQFAAETRSFLEASGHRVIFIPVEFDVPPFRAYVVCTIDDDLASKIRELLENWPSKQPL